MTTKDTQLERDDWTDFGKGGPDKHGWLPIESAPRDGTLMLLCEVPHDWVGIGKYLPSKNGPQWILAEGWAVFATHWQALPHPPEEVS